MVPQKINEGASGLLVLLLLLLLLSAVRPYFSEGETGGSFRDRPFFVEIEGDVPRPAVYGFSHPPTLRELVNASGKPGRDGSSALIPEGPRFPSGAKVLFRREGNGFQVSQGDMSVFYRITLGIPLPLNRISEEELTALPGIGPALAKAIVEERRRRGGFKNLEEIGRIPRIGQKLFMKISPYLVL